MSLTPEREADIRGYARSFLAADEDLPILLGEIDRLRIELGRASTSHSADAKAACAAMGDLRETTEARIAALINAGESLVCVIEAEGLDTHPDIATWREVAFSEERHVWTNDETEQHHRRVLGLENLVSVEHAWKAEQAGGVACCCDICIKVRRREARA